MIQHEKYIEKCIELAKLGEGKVSPNPLVGAVVLDKDGSVAGEGLHEKHGEAHAEINALDQAGERAKDGTLYINLEPCNHYGKTPPCIDRVLNSGIKTLVLGMTDPNPKVAGKSIIKAKNAGIEVIENVLNKECLKLNEIFIKNINENKPFIALKTASTLDGKIATSSGQSKWITSEKAREEVHRLRNRYDAIITGSGTVIADNPSLTCRMAGGRNPVRIIMDTNLVTPENSKVYKNDGTRVIIVTSEGVDEARKNDYPKNVEIWEFSVKENKPDLENFIYKLYNENICSVLLESGAKLNGAFLKQKIVDKFYLFLAPKIIGDKNALSSVEGFALKDLNECIKLDFEDIKIFSPDILIESYLNY